MFKKVSFALAVSFLLNGCASLQDYDRRFKEAMQNSFSHVKSMFGAYQTYEIHDPENKELPLLVAGKNGVSSINFDLEVYDLATKALVFDALVEEVIHEKKKPYEVEVFEAGFYSNKNNFENSFRITKQYDTNNDRIIEMDEVVKFLEKKVHRPMKNKAIVVEETNNLITDARDKYKTWILAQATCVSLYASGKNQVKKMNRNNSEINVELKREKLFLEIKNAGEKTFLYVHDLRENTLKGYEEITITEAVNNLEDLANNQEYNYTNTDNKNEYLEALVNMRDYQAEVLKNRSLRN